MRIYLNEGEQVKNPPCAASGGLDRDEALAFPVFFNGVVSEHLPAHGNIDARLHRLYRS